jgi:formate hydrogenlyase subunit 4
MEWAHALKLMVYAGIGIALFAPWGVSPAGRWDLVPAALAALAAKLFIGGLALAVLETVSARMRIFRAPEFLGMAFLLAVLGMLILLLQGQPR